MTFPEKKIDDPRIASDREPFRLSPEQYRLYEDLKILSPGPAAFFRDACRLMADGELDSTTHLVGHLVREIESALRDVLAPIGVDEQPQDTKSNSKKHRFEIEQILDGFGVSPAHPISIFWLSQFTELHVWAHRKNLNPPRPLDTKFRDHWKGFQDVFQGVLLRFKRDYQRVFQNIDQCCVEENPTKETVERLLSRLPRNNAILGYLFSKIPNSRWFPPLRKRDLFAYPPNLVINEDGSTSIPSWPQAAYIIRIASEMPDQVLDLLLTLDTDNFLIMGQFTQAAGKFAPPKAAKWAERLAEWFDAGHSGKGGVERPTIELVSLLASKDHIGPALALFRSMIEIQPDPDYPYQGKISEEATFVGWPKPRLRVENWMFRSILEKCSQRLADVDPAATLSILLKTMEQAIRFFRHTQDQEKPVDHSYIWQPVIDSHEQDTDSDFRGSLVEAILKTAETLCRENPDAQKDLISKLDGMGWKFFLRLGLHLLRISPNQNVDLIREKLLTRIYWEDFEIQREYSQLLGAQFSGLPPEDQRTILEWIEEGVQPTTSSSQGRETAEEHSTQDLATHERWQLEKLAPIAHALEPEWRAKFDHLVEKFGAPSQTLPFSMSTGWKSPPSPLTEEKLDSMTVHQVAEFILNWVPPEEWMGPSPAALGLVLKNDVMKRPTAYVQEIRSFLKIGIDPTYLRNILYGLAPAAKDSKVALPWEHLLLFGKWVTQQPRVDPVPEGVDATGRERDPHWGWARQAVVELLQKGFDSDLIPITKRNDAWEILEVISRDPDAGKEQTDAKPTGPYELAMNSTRGTALVTVFHYSLWVYRAWKRQQGDSQIRWSGMENIPEVKDVLEFHLDQANEPALSIRSIYGAKLKWLHFLDESWVEKNLSRLFPEKPDEVPFFRTTLNSYLLFGEPLPGMLRVLRPVYQRAVRELKNGILSAPSRCQPEARLAEYLMVHLIRGDLDMNDPLCQEFFSNATDEIRAKAIGFLGHSQKEGEPATQAVLNRLRKLWEWRLEWIRQSRAHHEHAQELAAFGWWFFRGDHSDPWLLEMMVETLSLPGDRSEDRRIFSRLATVGPKYPDLAAKCFRLLVDRNQAGWFWGSPEPQEKEFLRVLLQDSDPDVRQSIRESINLLLAHGANEYRDILLPASAFSPPGS
ncbi:MAG: hypothetical protein WA705_31280 [Candidatus Ozemobacteraceae bacterium]